MTRKEAIKNLKELLKWYLEEEWMSETVYKREALDMAISALSEELSEDGTLTVHVSDGSKVKRVFVMGDNIFGGLYYPDSAENKGDLISRQAVLDELEKWDWQELYLPIHFKQILDDIPSAENKCFEGTTKGEAFMSLFPNAVDEEQAKWFFGLEWWNAPYKAEREETNDKNHS